jgi:uncharacterized protein YkwD
MNPVFMLLVGLTLTLCGSAIAQTSSATPAQMISKYRLQHGEGPVTPDPILTRIAQEQAATMAARDALDHSVLAPFNARVSSSGSGRAAENIAYGHESFAQTLNQWIESSGHRKNLLMHGASRIGVASAKSTRTSRTYWAMVIADRREPSTLRAVKQQTQRRTTKHQPQHRACRITIFNLCL